MSSGNYATGKDQGEFPCFGMTWLHVSQFDGHRCGSCPFHHEPQLKIELQKVSTRDTTSHELMQLSCADVIVKMIWVASDILHSQRMLEMGCSSVIEDF